MPKITAADQPIIDKRPNSSVIPRCIKQAQDFGYPNLKAALQKYRDDPDESVAVIAVRFGVSEDTIFRWCRTLGIKQQTRGHVWRELYYTRKKGGAKRREGRMIVGE